MFFIVFKNYCYTYRFLPVMVLTTLTVLWMNPIGIDRFCLCCTNLLMQMTYISYVRWELPSHGETTPTLGEFPYLKTKILNDLFQFVLRETHF